MWHRTLPLALTLPAPRYLVLATIDARFYLPGDPDWLRVGAAAALHLGVGGRSPSNPADPTKSTKIEMSQSKRSKPVTHSIALVPGDGIGVDVIESGVEALKALEAKLGTFGLEFVHYPYSVEHYQQHGCMMPEDGIQKLSQHDAIYFGACGWPSVPDHITLWQLTLPIRKQLRQYINLRPVRVLKGSTFPLKCNAQDIDWVFVRENSEGEYSGQGGRTHPGEPFEMGTEVAIFTRPAIQRVMHFAFKTAQSRPKKHLTIVTKSNAQRHGMVLWDEVAMEVAKSYPDVHTDKILVDAMTVAMVNRPQTMDTIVATNLHADILTDLAAALAGSVGIATSANFNPDKSTPGMFEPIHGSAPDIKGQGIANPIGALWAGADMLSHLGEAQASALLMEAIEFCTANGKVTKDMGGSLSTKEVTEQAVEFIRQA